MEDGDDSYPVRFDLVVTTIGKAQYETATGIPVNFPIKLRGCSNPFEHDFDRIGEFLAEIDSARLVEVVPLLVFRFRFRIEDYIEIHG